MSELMCAYCLVLPGRSQGTEALAWTVVNGRAACKRHLDFAYSWMNWGQTLEAARDYELGVLGDEEADARFWDWVGLNPHVG